MNEKPAADTEQDAPPATPPEPPMLPARERFAALGALGALLLVAGAMLGAWWGHGSAQDEVRRLGAEIAEIRARLETRSDLVPEAALEALADRIVVLETLATAPPVPPAPVSVAAPVLTDPAILFPADPVPAMAAAPDASPADCMPTGTRFLVSAGDAYPICGTPGLVSVASVGDISVSFVEGSPILVGGSAIVPGTTCIVAVLSANADGMTGFGELRVTC